MKCCVFKWILHDPKRIGRHGAVMSLYGYDCECAILHRLKHAQHLPFFACGKFIRSQTESLFHFICNNANFIRFSNNECQENSGFSSRIRLARERTDGVIHTEIGAFHEIFFKNNSWTFVFQRIPFVRCCCC